MTNGTTGPLDVAAAKRKKAYDDFVDVANGEFERATKAKADSEKAVQAIDPNDAGVEEGGLEKARREALEAWQLAQEDAEKAETAVKDALGNLTLAGLRSEVTSKSEDWDKQQIELVKKQNDVADKLKTLNEATALKEARVEKCQLDAYDAYRKTLKGLLD